MFPSFFSGMKSNWPAILSQKLIKKLKSSCKHWFTKTCFFYVPCTNPRGLDFSYCNYLEKTLADLKPPHWCHFAPYLQYFSDLGPWSKECVLLPSSTNVWGNHQHYEAPQFSCTARRLHQSAPGLLGKLNSFLESDLHQVVRVTPIVGTLEMARMDQKPVVQKVLKHVVHEASGGRVVRLIFGGEK